MSIFHISCQISHRQIFVQTVNITRKWTLHALVRPRCYLSSTMHHRKACPCSVITTLEFETWFTLSDLDWKLMTSLISSKLLCAEPQNHFGWGILWQLHIKHQMYQYQLHCSLFFVRLWYLGQESVRRMQYGIASVNRKSTQQMTIHAKQA